MANPDRYPAPMNAKRSPAPARSRIDLVAIWVLAVVGLLALVVSAGVVLDENLRAYALCAEASSTLCPDGPWYSSMGLAFFGGIVVVTTGFFLGLRRYGRGRIGAWFPSRPSVPSPR